MGRQAAEGLQRSPPSHCTSGTGPCHRAGVKHRQGPWAEELQALQAHPGSLGSLGTAGRVGTQGHQEAALPVGVCLLRLGVAAGCHQLGVGTHRRRLLGVAAGCHHLAGLVVGMRLLAAGPLIL